MQKIVFAAMTKKQYFAICVTVFVLGVLETVNLFAVLLTEYMITAAPTIIAEANPFTNLLLSNMIVLFFVHITIFVGLGICLTGILNVDITHKYILVAGVLTLVAIVFSYDAYHDFVLFTELTHIMYPFS